MQRFYLHQVTSALCSVVWSHLSFSGCCYFCATRTVTCTHLHGLITVGVVAMIFAIMSYRPITDGHGTALFMDSQCEIKCVQSVRWSTSTWPVCDHMFTASKTVSDRMRHFFCPFPPRPRIQSLIAAKCTVVCLSERKREIEVWGKSCPPQ